MKKFLRISILLAGILAICSCKGGSGKALLPNVSGKAGEVLVVIEKADWEGAVGGILRDSLAADCPYLPQKEPLYTLINITPGNFAQMFQIHRNLILMNISAGVNVPGVVYRYDKWSHPQIVITVNAPTAEAAVELLSQNMHTIIGAIEQAEINRVVNNTRNYQEAKLAREVKQWCGGNMVFPSGWSLKKKTENFMWISYETTYVQQGVMIYRYPAFGTREEMSVKAIVDRRNDVLREQVPGMVEGSYMTTSNILYPTLRYASYKDLKFAQVRGLWDVHGDFMGGPFVSHTFYRPDGRELYCVEGYVYAPKYDKRLYLRQVESLLYSFEWDKAK